MWHEKVGIHSVQVTVNVLSREVSTVLHTDVASPYPPLAGMEQRRKDHSLTWRMFQVDTRDMLIFDGK